MIATGQRRDGQQHGAARQIEKARRIQRVVVRRGDVARGIIGERWAREQHVDGVGQAKAARLGEHGVAGPHHLIDWKGEIEGAAQFGDLGRVGERSELGRGRLGGGRFGGGLRCDRLALRRRVGRGGQRGGKQQRGQHMARLHVRSLPNPCVTSSTIRRWVPAFAGVTKMFLVDPSPCRSLMFA